MAIIVIVPHTKMFCFSRRMRSVYIQLILLTVLESMHDGLTTSKITTDCEAFNLSVINTQCNSYKCNISHTSIRRRQKWTDEVIIQKMQNDIREGNIGPTDESPVNDSMNSNLPLSIDNQIKSPMTKLAVENKASAASQLERTRKHFEKLQKRDQRLGGNRMLSEINSADDVATTTSPNSIKFDPIGMERERIYESYIQLPASDLKNKCIQRQINDKGRKPDLAQRLTQDDIIAIYGLVQHGKDEEDIDAENFITGRTLISGMVAEGNGPSTTSVLTNFAGLYPLSKAAQSALTLAQFVHPTTIQSKAIPILSSGRSAIIHAATGSGKTLAYLLPFTERLWHEHPTSDDNNHKVALILTPTRELAAQVAGIASILSPPGTVRFVTRPSNLLSRMKQERADGNDMLDTPTRIYVGSAKVIYQSLYGDGRMPASPTTKPEAMSLLQNTGYLVLDEVDRLLGVVGGVNNHNNPSSAKKSKSSYDSGTAKTQNVNIHEKPAAILTAAVSRLALGKATTVAASATVGRPLRRELARCMGLTPQECPIIIRDCEIDDDSESKMTNFVKESERSPPSSSTVGRAVTIPSTVSHYVVPVVDGTSPGKILTSAFTAIQSIGPHRRMLLVLTRNFGITTQNAIGALKHFRCQPEPISLLDALETTDGTEAMMEVHRQVTGVSGVGSSQLPSSVQQQHGYLLVTGEDSVRGLHLDGLDVVLVASRSVGPDEYTHIAGRTGRAGRSGSVVNIVSDVDVGKVTAWEKMLNITFISCPTPKAIGSMLGTS